MNRNIELRPFYLDKSVEKMVLNELKIVIVYSSIKESLQHLINVDNELLRTIDNGERKSDIKTILDSHIDLYIGQLSELQRKLPRVILKLEK